MLVSIILAGTRTALACACCTNEGQRNVATVELDSGKRQEIESLRFGGKATLFTGEGDPGIKGITTPSGSYDLTAKWLDNRLVFSFRDKGGRSGTLALARPTRYRYSRSIRATPPTRAKGRHSTRNGSCRRLRPAAAYSPPVRVRGRS